jgi:hypothetical protein
LRGGDVSKKAWKNWEQFVEQNPERVKASPARKRVVADK